MALGKLGNKGGSKKSTFNYKPTHKAETAKQRATQQGGQFESVVLDHVKVFTPKQGDFDVRILPPTWNDPEHFGYDVWQHYGIGPDESTYLCIEKMREEKCPICEERNKVGDKDKDLSDALKPGRRVAVWIVDRNNEKEGVQLWTMPWTFDRDVMALAIDKKSGEIFQLDDPEEGYDVSFSVQGEKLQKKYVGIQVARRSSPLHEDSDKAAEWLQYAVDNSIPEVFNFKDYEYLSEQLMGGVRDADTDKNKDKEDKDRPRVGRGGLSSRDKEEKGEGLTWEGVHDLDGEGLEELVKEKDLDEDEFKDCENKEQIADKVCELLDIKPSKEEKEDKKSSGAGGLKERLAALRNKKK